MKAETPATVLLVDDDDAVRSVLQQTLAHAGYHVLIATNGEEALTQHSVHREVIRVVITDLRMPVIGGRELAQALLQHQPGLPIIFISGDPGTDSWPSEETNPNQFFMQKPFMPSELVAQIARMLGA